MAIRDFIRRSLGGPATPNATQTPNKPDWQAATELCLKVILALCALGLLTAVAYGARDSIAGATRYLLWGLGLLFTGTFIGFLFGLPRVSPSAAAPAPPPTNQPAPAGAGNVAQTQASTATRGTDAMLEIADWLAKIIAGLGLVNLKEAPALMDRLASAMACPTGNHASWCAGPWPFAFFMHPGKGACDHSFALAVGVFFPVAGLILGYLVTRLFLQTALVTSDRTTRDAVNAPLPVSELMKEYRQSEAAAQAITGNRKLPANGADPDAATINALASLNAQYTNVTIPDYNDRVRRKDELAKQMYDLAVQRQVPKAWLAAQSGDGFINVLATSVLADAAAEDVPGLLRVVPAARMKHVKFRIVQAFQKLLETQLVGPEEAPLIQSLLSGYLADADGPLRSIIELVRAKLA